MIIATIGLIFAAVCLAHGEYQAAGAGVALMIFGLLLDITRLP